MLNEVRHIADRCTAWHRTGLILCGLLLLLSGALSPAHAKTLHTERSLYRNIVVFEENGERCMAFGRYNTGRQTCVSSTDPDRLILDYTRLMLGSLYLNPAPMKVLIIGLGGGVLPTVLPRFSPMVQIDVVEIDPAVVRVARKYFGFTDRPGTRVHEQDGRVFVKRMLKRREKYDLIMLDAFDHDYIPEHLLTREFLAEVKALLTDKGVLAANTFSSSQLYHSESVTYAEVFGPFFNLRRLNRVILIRNGGLPDVAELEANAEQVDAKMQQLGIEKDALIKTMSTRKDWSEKARVLTDQYSPSNLLNAS